MYIIVNKDGSIWNHRAQRFQAESDSMGQAYSGRHEANKAVRRIESLQLQENLEVMTYTDWAQLTGGTW